MLGRLGAQEAAWMMFKERPAFGYGPSTFPDLVISYAGRVPTAVLKPALRRTTSTPSSRPHRGETGCSGGRW